MTEFRKLEFMASKNPFQQIAVILFMLLIADISKLFMRHVPMNNQSDRFILNVVKGY